MMCKLILTTKNSDQFYLSLFKQGKEVGLNYYYKHLYDSTFNYACGIIKDRFRIHSYIQDAFLLLWESRVKIKDTFHIFNFIRLVVRRNCYTYLKHKEQSKIDIISCDNLDIHTITWPIIVNEIREQEARSEKDELLMLIRNAIPYLKSDSKTIIKLYYYGFKASDISNICGHSYRSVYYKLSKGFKELELISKRLRKRSQHAKKEELIFLSNYKTSISQQHLKILELYAICKHNFKTIGEKLNISPFMALQRYQEAIQECNKLKKKGIFDIKYAINKT